MGLWSDILGNIINTNQIYGQPTSAITPAAPPPKLGGFGEGPQADVRNNTTYPRTESLPPLGGFGEGPQPQIPSHTGHPPTVSGIPEKLEGFGAGPQADVSHVFASNSTKPGKDPVDPTKDPWNSRDLGLSDRATKALKRLENLKKDPVGDVNSQANHNHYSAARREADGQIVAKRSDGKPYSHIGDLQRACDGLYNVRDALEADLRNPPDTITSRGIDVLAAKFKEVQILINRLNGFLSNIGHGKFPPYHEWKPGSTPGSWIP